MNPRMWYAGCVWLCFVGCLPALETPRLSISNAAEVLTISWPGTAYDWALDQADTLTPPVPWARVPAGQYETNEDSRLVRMPTAAAGRFYRLRWASGANEALTGLWALDEGTGKTASDAGGAGEALATVGTTWGAGRIGPGGLHFSGSSSYAWVSNASQRVLPPSGRPFSVSFWFNPDSVTTGWRGLAGTDTGGTNGWVVALHVVAPGTNELVFSGAGAGSSLSVTGRTLLLPGQWHQLAVTHDGSNGCLYLDGVILGAGVGTIGSQGGPLYFGGGVGGHPGFLGLLDDVRAYTNCLSRELISLAGHWRFDEGNGTQAGDSGLFGNHGRVGEGAAWVAGKIGTGLQLGPGLVTISNRYRTVLPPDSGCFSVSFWYRPSSLAEGWRGIMHSGVAGLSGWELALETTATGHWLHWSATNRGGTVMLQVPVAVANDEWIKWDLTYNGGIATAYANGQIIGSSYGAIRPSREPLILGAVPGLPVGAAVLDELQIFRHERAASEIGPVAETMWETVFRGTTTNVVLRVSGPAGRPLTCALVPVMTPTNGVTTLLGNSVSYAAGLRKGPDAFTYTVTDGEFTSPPTVVSFSVVEPHWISPDGGLLTPRDGTSPERAWQAGPVDAYHGVLTNNNYYDCFFYAPGEYHTRGFKWMERATAFPGCKHVGSGSSGVNRTVVKFVEAIEPWNEGVMFFARDKEFVDGYEMHHMVLDCNGDNLPKHVRGKPVRFDIPLAATGLVSSVTLRWRNEGQLGRAAEYSLAALKAGTNTFATNITVAPGSYTDVIPVGAVADEIRLTCLLRAPGVSYYSLAEVEVAGPAPSAPSAKTPGGSVSQLTSAHGIAGAVDDDANTAWASGAEPQAEIELPVAGGTAVSQVSIQWRCKTLAGTGRLGPADAFSIHARDESSGVFVPVSFVRHAVDSEGIERCTFGTAEATNVVTTDRIKLVLTHRALGTDFYSIREVSLQNGPLAVPMRLAYCFDSQNAGELRAVRAVDQDLNSYWSSGTQGQISAIDVGGNNLKFTDLWIRGFGTKAGKEGFPLHIWAQVLPGGPLHMGNVLVEDCLLSEPASNNTEGISVVTVYTKSPNTLTNAVVRRCAVKGLRSHFPTVQGFLGVHLEDNLVEDAHMGAYYEMYYDDNLKAVIRSNRFVNTILGVFVLSYPGVKTDHIVVVGNEFVLAGDYGAAFGVCDACSEGPGSSITNVVALGNTARYADWMPRPGSQDSGFGYGDMHNAVIANNVVALGTPNGLRVRQCPAGVITTRPLDDCLGVLPPPPPDSSPPCVDVLRPGYRRAWFNNRDLNGTLLPMRFISNGVDGLATQQQWDD